MTYKELCVFILPFLYSINAHIELCHIRAETTKSDECDKINLYVDKEFSEPSDISVYLGPTKHAS